MAKAGWLSIRNLPFLKDKKSVSNVYYKELKGFFSKFTLCPECNGRGFVMRNEKQYVQNSEVCTIRFQGIEELEHLNDMEDVVTSEVVRDILEYILHGKKSCSSCNGFRFIKHKKAAKLKRVS